MEKETLACTWACNRFAEFLLGVDFVLETDHKPLVALLGSKSLDELPARIQRMRMRMMRFSYSVVHAPGKLLYTADTLSRAPLGGTTVQDQEMMSDILAFVDLVVDGLPATDLRLEQIRTHQQEDETCKLLSMYGADGWPERNALAGTLQQYWPYRSDLTIQLGLLMYSTRIVIPSVLCLEMLDRIHYGHQGIVKCRWRAKDSIWWPGLSREIEDLVRLFRIGVECKCICTYPKDHNCMHQRLSGLQLFSCIIYCTRDSVPDNLSSMPSMSDNLDRAKPFKGGLGSGSFYNPTSKTNSQTTQPNNFGTICTITKKSDLCVTFGKVGHLFRAQYKYDIYTFPPSTPSLCCHLDRLIDI